MKCLLAPLYLIAKKAVSGHEFSFTDVKWVPDTPEQICWIEFDGFETFFFLLAFFLVFSIFVSSGRRVRWSVHICTRRQEIGLWLRSLMRKTRRFLLRNASLCIISWQDLRWLQLVRSWKCLTATYINLILLGSCLAFCHFYDLAGLKSSNRWQSIVLIGRLYLMSVLNFILACDLFWMIRPFAHLCSSILDWTIAAQTEDRTCSALVPLTSNRLFPFLSRFFLFPGHGLCLKVPDFCHI